MIMFGLVFMATFLGIYLCIPNKSVKAYSITDQCGVGYTINAVTDGYADPCDVNYGVSVLSDSFMDSITLNRATLHTSSSNIVGNTSLSSLIHSMNASYSASSSIPIEIDDFSLQEENAYSLALSEDYSSYYSRYYYEQEADINIYSLSIPQYLDYTQYQSNLSTMFTADLNRVATGTMTYEQLFNKYGTHMIASARYGGRMNIYYSFLSNQVIFTSSIQNSINNNLSACFGNVVNLGSASMGFSLNSVSGLTSSNTTLGIYLKAVGGIPFVIRNTNTSDFSQDYNNWVTSLADNSECSLIGYGTQGLIPIWELIPDTSYYAATKSGLENYYSTYVANNSLSVSDTYDTYDGPYTANIYTTAEKTIRGYEYIIDRNDETDNDSDFINLGERFDINPDILEDAGYTTATITLKMQIREVANGTQSMFLYNNTNCSSSSRIWSNDEEIGGSQKISSYGTVYTYNITVAVSDLESDVLQLRYSCINRLHSWGCTNVKMYITFNKT